MQLSRYYHYKMALLGSHKIGGKLKLRCVRHLLSAHGLVYHAKAHVERDRGLNTIIAHTISRPLESVTSLAHPLDTPLTPPSIAGFHAALFTFVSSENQPLRLPPGLPDFSAKESFPPSSDICYTTEFVYSVPSTL